MLDYPTTIEEARKYRYGIRASFPNGAAYREGFCAHDVWAPGNWPIETQCSRRAKTGPGKLYCTIHAKKVSAR